MKEKKTGNRKTNLDLEKIKYDLMCGCSGVALADEFGVHPDTLYDFVKKETGMKFSEFTQIMKQKGNDNIHKRQYETAMSGQKESVPLLIWLGKQRLGQREKSETDTNIKLNGGLSIFEQMQKENESENTDKAKS